MLDRQSLELEWDLLTSSLTLHRLSSNPRWVSGRIGRFPPQPKVVLFNRAAIERQNSHSTAISGEEWPDDVRLSDLEPRFVCKACRKRRADVRPDFNWDRQPGP
jgi:hypothetical protein